MAKKKAVKGYQGPSQDMRALLVGFFIVAVYFLGLTVPNFIEDGRYFILFIQAVALIASIYGLIRRNRLGRLAIGWSYMFLGAYFISFILVVLFAGIADLFSLFAWLFISGMSFYGAYFIFMDSENYFSN